MDGLTSMLEKSIAFLPRFLREGGEMKPSASPFVSSNGEEEHARGLPGGVRLPLDPLKVETESAPDVEEVRRS